MTTHSPPASLTSSPLSLLSHHPPYACTPLCPAGLTVVCVVCATLSSSWTRANGTPSPPGPPVVCGGRCMDGDASAGRRRKQPPLSLTRSSKAETTKCWCEKRNKAVGDSDLTEVMIGQNLTAWSTSKGDKGGPTTPGKARKFLVQANSKARQDFLAMLRLHRKPGCFAYLVLGSGGLNQATYPCQTIQNACSIHSTMYTTCFYREVLDSVVRKQSCKRTNTGKGRARASQRLMADSIINFFCCLSLIGSSNKA